MEKIFKILVFGFCIANIVYANDGFDDEFEDDTIEIIEVTKKVEPNFVYYGSTTVSTEYNYEDKKRFSPNTISTDLKLEYSINNIGKIKSTTKAYRNFNTNITNDYDLEFNELTFQGTFNNNIDWKIGRQIVVWGKSDNIRIVDTLNPLDNTAFGMVDIKDLRLGRNMTKLDYYFSNWALSGIILHENRYSKMAKYGSDYYLRPNIAPPSNALRNNGLAISLAGNFQGQDVAFYASNQYIDNTNYRSNMFGFAYNKVIDNILLKTELAYFDNYDNDLIASTTDSLAGFEYTGISDGSISFELANKNNRIWYATRFSQSYLNQTLDFTALYSVLGKDSEDGGFVRAWFDYDYNDDISLSLGFINYLNGNLPQFKKFQDNDRIFSSLKYSF